MSQSNSESELRLLKHKHSELVSILRQRDEKIPPIASSTNKFQQISWLKKAVKGLEAQVNTKRTTKTAPKASVSKFKGKFTKKAALQYINSYEQTYDEDNIKDLEDLRKRSKAKSSLKKLKKFDEKTKLYNWLIKEFDL